jgi:hypothetical protein
VHVAVHTAIGTRQWMAAATSLPFDATAGSPWLLVPPAVRAAFDAMTESGTPLADTTFGAPMLGVKCGCNAAFVVAHDPSPTSASPVNGSLVAVRASVDAGADAPGRRGLIERAVLRPVVRGQTLGRWVRTTSVCDGQPPETTGRSRRGPEWIIWTHSDAGADAGGPRLHLPPYTARWLSHWRHRLAARSDTRGQLPWWTLFRTDSADSVQPRVVWSDLGRVPRAVVLPVQDPTVPLNSCYVVRAPDLIDAQALTALLNSAPAAAWLNVLAEPARGSYRRYMGWTVALLPLPRQWAHARAVMAPIAERAAGGTPPSESQLTETVIEAYRLDLDTIRPLLAWTGA